MQNKKDTDDLDYLAGLGFEKIPVSNSEIRKLSLKVRRRFFPGGSTGLVILSLLAGAGIAVVVMRGLPSGTSQPEVSRNIPPALSENVKQPEVAEQLIQLDTVRVVQENFVSPLAKHSPATLNTVQDEAGESDTLDVVPMETISGFQLVGKGLTERRLRFIINSPVVYIHDLKVSDYRNLYFRKNQFVRIDDLGLPASQSLPDDATSSRLKQEATYFLHEELARALRDFNKGRYEQAMNKLQEVEQYNKSDINCDFYIGMCWYHRKNYANAIERLSNCLGNPNNAFLQEAMYYKALALLELGRREEAVQLLKKIEEEGEFYAVKAAGLLKGL